MSDNKTIVIERKIEISKSRLWLIWLLLFVFPSIIAIATFNYIKSEYYYFTKTEEIHKAFDDIKKYNDLIAPESFMEEQLDKIKKLDTNLNQNELKIEIDKVLLGETLFCIFFSNNANVANIIKSKNSKNIPVTILKKHIKELIEINSYDKLQTDLGHKTLLLLRKITPITIPLNKISKNYIKEIIIANSNNKKEKIKKEFGQKLQLLFKTITSITISLNKISKNFSVAYDGELYFIFSELDNKNKDCSYLFAVMKGKDFSYIKMLENLQKRFPQIKIVFKNLQLNEIEEGYFYSGIKRNNNETYIYAPASLIFARHVAHNGTAILNPKYNKLFPFIKYDLNSDEIKNNLNDIEKTIHFIALTIILLSTTYFLYISLFDFNPNLTFKKKMLVLIIISAMFPFSIFIIGIYSYERYNRFITKLSVQHKAEVELHFASKELDYYVNEIESKLTEYSSNLSDLLSNPKLELSTLSDYLSFIGNEIPLSKETLFLKPVPNNLKNINIENDIGTIIASFAGRVSKELIEEKNDTYINGLTSTYLLYSNEESPKDREPKDYLKVYGNNVPSQEIGQALSNDGKLIPIIQNETTTWFYIQQIHNKKNKTVTGLYFVKFEPIPILSFFFSKYSSLAKIGYKEKKENYEINYSFIPVEKSGSASLWKESGIELSNEDRKLCLNNQQTSVIELNNKSIITKENVKIPHLAIAVIKEINPYTEIELLILTTLSIIAYLALILYFSNKLLEVIFIEPVSLLTANALSIAKGGDEWNTEINSGDEFEDLNNNFKNLVTGLRERNILKSYVSEDAFSDIEGSSDTNLKPGGEYIEATIVFSAIKDYDKLSLSITPKESIKLLSKFMSIAEEVTKKYNGSIDKIIGDTIMLVFRNNTSLHSHGLRAAKASLELVEKAKEADLPNLYTGIASGRVISGKIGSYSGKLDFTVIGNPVNSAARFKAESKNGTEQTGIIISGTTIGLTKGKAKVKFLRRVSIKGKSRKYNIYELVGIR